MKIYSMTATFGKLDHETLNLQPGFNIIEAPNEWGKSTWCAFLVAMLYGIETRSHTTRTALADKDRYAPWSGAPMSGRMDLNWNGKDITIERRSKGRSVFSEFKAYETATGLSVADLTGDNCGQVLLGVEKSVFLRSGFLRLTDLPVTQDESLRSRLNALVTTGDESGTADMLAQKLKELKNRCRFNRTGLLPQAQAQRSELANKLRELSSLQEQQHSLSQQKNAVESRISDLENHQAALAFAAAQEDAARVFDAQQEKQRWEAVLQAAEDRCTHLPDADKSRDTLQTLGQLQQQLTRIHGEESALAPAPEMPSLPGPFRGLSATEAVKAAEADAKAYSRSRKLLPLWIFLSLLVCVITATTAWYATKTLYALAVALPMCILAYPANACWIRHLKKQRELKAKYSNPDPKTWLKTAREYAKEMDTYAQALSQREAARVHLQQQRVLTQQQLQEATTHKTPEEAAQYYRDALAAQENLAEARKEYQRSISILALAQAMAKTAPPPPRSDSLTYDSSQTQQLLSDSIYQLRQLDRKISQCAAQMTQLGQQEALQKQLDAVDDRIGQLEDTYAALSIAQQALSAATAELQRRYAPRLSKRAQEIFADLTENRYDRIRLDENLALQAGTRGEDTLRSILWRSDGTADQLYLALRLAVAEELTPDAPMILDDALVRFDDKRLEAAMKILRSTAQRKQVILFTCQGREKQY